MYYQGFAELRLGRPADARRTFQTLAVEERRSAYLAEGGGAARGGVRRGARRSGGGARHLRAARENEDDGARRCADAAGHARARAAGNPKKPTEAFLRVVYEFPFSDLAPIASSRARDAAGRRRSRRARTATSSSSDAPSGCSAPSATRRRVRRSTALRQLGAGRRPRARAAAARGMRLLPEAAARRARRRQAVRRQGVARRARRSSSMRSPSRDLGDHAEYLRVVRRLVDEFPTQSWAEEALNNLATHYILAGRRREGRRDVPGAVREISRRPLRGARRVEDRLVGLQEPPLRRDAVRAFESAAAQFPRSDYRPAWLYWSAQAHEALKERAGRRGALHPRRHRLPEHLLRPPRGRTARRAAATPARARQSTDPPAADDAGTPSPALPPNEARRARAARARSLRPGARRAPLRAEGVGRFVGHSGDDRLDFQPARRSARRHQRDEARLSAVHGGRRREAAARAAEGALPGELLAADSALFGRARARPVHDGGADRAGVDVHGRRQVGRQRLRADADHARPPAASTRGR